MREKVLLNFELSAKVKKKATDPWERKQRRLGLDRSTEKRLL